MKRQPRLTRREKIEQAAAIKAQTIDNPRHLIGLPAGRYSLTGGAAEACHHAGTLLLGYPGTAKTH